MRIIGNASIGVYTLTESGRQILKLINNTQTLDDYFMDVFKDIKTHNNGAETNAFRMISKSNDEIEYDDSVDLLNID